MYSVVLDTSVLIAGLRSATGASFAVLEGIGRNFELNISVPLVLEYEAVTKRQAREIGLTFKDIDDFLDYVCSVAHHRLIYYLWRPVLRDPNDDLVLELAVESNADYLVTHNIRDFAGSEQFGVCIVSPREFLGILRSKGKETTR
ncbi:MAG: putative toxin-antitoxin system toxin component, PIN family [Gemmatimonadaceae bacterium]|nr:putative toxin-antitoxin system toxin component, PIN family [Gemmatimonadaceae bacterium]